MVFLLHDMSHVETEGGGKGVGGLWVVGGDTLPAKYSKYQKNLIGNIGRDTLPAKYSKYLKHLE